MPFLHLPVQSGSDRILTAMNRQHNVASYLALIDRLRASRPDLALSSDFIVGFPGETDADFQATLDLVTQVGFAQAYSFKYSPRPGTPAELLAAQVPEEIKDARLSQLQALITEHQIAFNRTTLGKSIDVLFDRPGKRSGQWIGRSPYSQSVHAVVKGEPIGKILPVTINKAGPNSLGGEVTDEMESACAA
jgi:tRNA-2-methylthio-N6-dimethylallyladenosine synthase